MYSEKSGYPLATFVCRFVAALPFSMAASSAGSGVSCLRGVSFGCFGHAMCAITSSSDSRESEQQRKSQAAASSAFSETW